MKDLPALSQAERNLIAELLESERKNLHPEIRRTRTASMHDDLRDRLTLVEKLLEKLGVVVES